MISIGEELFKVWLLMAFTLGLWTCAQLFISQRHKQIKFCLLSFVALLLIPTANAYITLVLGKSLPLLNALSQNLTLAYGPILLLSCTTLLGRKTQLAYYSGHFLPFILVCLDRALGGQVTHKGDGLYFIGFLFAQVFTYLGLSLRCLYQDKLRVTHLRQHHKNSSYYWLLFLILGLTTVMLFDLGVISYMLTAQQFPNPLLLAVSVTALSVYNNIIALGALIQPKIFNGVDCETISDSSSNNNSDNSSDNSSNNSPEARSEENTITGKTKKPRSIRQVELSPEQAAQLDQQLNALVTEHRVHLDETMSLAKLASLLGITRNQLSELLNIHKQLSFYDFMNQLRLQEALELIRSSGKQLTNIDIAYRAGFNNRNSFYKVFKESTGMTPSEYQKQQID